jgi:hypothetical protein
LELQNFEFLKLKKNMPMPGVQLLHKPRQLLPLFSFVIALTEPCPQESYRTFFKKCPVCRQAKIAGFCPRRTAVPTTYTGGARHSQKMFKKKP